MIQINLLPWREEARQAKKTRFAALVGCTVAAAFFVVLIFHLYYRSIINAQDKRNVYLQTQLGEEQVALNDLNAKLRVQSDVKADLQLLFQFRKNNYRVVQLLDTFTRVVPDEISFDKIIRKSDTIVVVGEAKSNIEVTTLIKNIANVSWFKQPNLTEIIAKESENKEDRLFQLTFQLQSEGQ